ncbi:MAG: type I secretion C-terminal target domain-containing protein [Alphaproteobacteria bacterium]|nr:type I secretion C-terminal target domain-containing protein [Alphaproteobacteria bacterium]
MPTSGDDFIFFEGAEEQLSVTLINPYSGEEIVIDQVMNVNQGIYDGLEGTDTLLFSNLGDALFLVDENGDIMIQNIEQFFAGAGGDIINLADANVTYGNVFISGGSGGDILWGNVGDDQIFGSDGDDIINGGYGYDFLDGGADNDEIRGSYGDDEIYGGAGDDTLYGGNATPLMFVDRDFVDNVVFPELQSGVNVGATASLGISNNNLTVDFDAQVSLTFREGFAGYNNTLGMYRIGANGEMEAAQILYTNVKDVGLNTAQIIDLPVGENGGEYAFFIIANGDRVNGEYNGLDNINDPGAIRFVYDFGGANERDALITDNGGDITIVYDDGVSVQALGGYHYHTTERGGDANLNWDGETHALSGLVDAENPDLLRIGFEDLPNLGDADYEDVLFDINVLELTVDNSEQGNDILVGGAGADLIYAEAGDDIIVGGADDDVLFGGAGSDTFLFQSFDGSVDTIKDFESGIGGDVINITDLLEGFDPMSDALSDFVQLSNSGGNTQVLVNADGMGTDFVAIAMIEGGAGASLANLINNGNIVGDQALVI